MQPAKTSQLKDVLSVYCFCFSFTAPSLSLASHSIHIQGNSLIHHLFCLSAIQWCITAADILP